MPNERLGLRVSLRHVPIRTITVALDRGGDVALHEYDTQSFVNALVRRMLSGAWGRMLESSLTAIAPEAQLWVLTCWLAEGVLEPTEKLRAIEMLAQYEESERWAARREAGLNLLPDGDDIRAAAAAMLEAWRGGKADE